MRRCVGVLLLVAAVAAQDEDDLGLEAIEVDADGVAADAGGVVDAEKPSSGGGRGPRHQKLAQDFARRRAEMAENTGGEGFTFSRMATPIRSNSRREFEEANIGDSDVDGSKFYAPGRTEAKVMRNLTGCLRRVRKKDASSYYDSIDCFESAITDFPLNSTWHKKLGTLYLLSGSPTRAVHMYNESVRLLFEMSKYETRDSVLLDNGGLGFLKLFAHRDHQGAVEVGKLKAFNYTFRLQMSDAWHIYEKFLLDADGMQEDDAQLLWAYVETLSAQGQWSAIPPVLNRLAALEDHLEGLPPVLLTLKLMSDSADLTARRLLSLPLRNATKDTKEAANKFIRKHCGRNDPPSSPTYSRVSLATFSIGCFLNQLKDGDELSALLKREAGVLKQDRGGFLQASPLHFAASLGGSEHDLLKTLVKMGVEVDAATRFGHTALHIAVAGGHYSTVRFLLQEKASLAAKDVRQHTPLEVACKHANWIDRREVARSFKEDPKEDICDKDEDEPLVLHVKQKPRKDFGGWEPVDPKAPEKLIKTLSEVQEPPAKLAGDNGESQIDVRKGDMSGIDLLMDYLLLGRPVLLRACFPNKLAKDFRKRDLLESLGGMRGRVELFANAEMYGVAGARVMNLSDFTAMDGGELPRTFSEKVPRFNKRKVATDVATVVPRNHPLTKVTSWEPPFLEFQGFQYNETHEPQLSVGPPGAGVAATVLPTAAAHFMPFGSRRWFLSPPPHAFASRRHPLEVFRSKQAEWRAEKADPLVGRSALEVHQYPGDVLVIPRDWSAVAVNIRETVSYSQAVDLDALWPVYDKEKKSKKKGKKVKKDAAASKEAQS
eukprot:TRINITY_DN16455_c0_g1_i1.p1 TRINITY_DN16455_c0_g1~~TRINITY_DN16455_c0_g1_i1.p1  ORF type:complete len:829 (+),score=310.72 TRINITY_DN16455_c0_g1_i1:83-2569(+)